MVLGRVVGAHGIRGQIRARWLGDGPENLLAAKKVELADARGSEDPAPQAFEIEGGTRGRTGEVRLALRGVRQREAAEALRGRLILVDAAELLHGERADPRRRHLRGACGTQLRLDLVGGCLGESGRHRPASERLSKSGGELVPVELLARAVALHDDQSSRLDSLVRREPGRARGALAAPSDRRGVVEVTGVDDAGLAFTALRAACGRLQGRAQS